MPIQEIITRYQGEIGGFDYDWNIASCTVVYKPDERFVAIGPFGRVLVIGGGNVNEEVPINDKGISPKKRGTLRAVRGIGGKAYAVGTMRQVYKRENIDTWHCIDSSAQNYIDIEKTDTCFESIDGFNEKEIYAVGWEGEIGWYNGETWKIIDSSTNTTLTNVRCAANGKCYASGKSGIILEGRYGDWKILKQELTKDNFWGMEWFNNTLYLSTNKALYLLENNNLKEVAFPNQKGSTFNHLSAKDGILWSIGAKDIFEFDGSIWKKLR